MLLQELIGVMGAPQVQQSLQRQPDAFAGTNSLEQISNLLPELARRPALFTVFKYIMMKAKDVQTAQNAISKYIGVTQKKQQPQQSQQPQQ